jgi:hypothetical protein
MLTKDLLPTATIRDCFARYGIRRCRRAFYLYIRSGKQSRELRRIRRQFAQLPMDDDSYTLCFLELVNITRENVAGPPPETRA